MVRDLEAEGLLQGRDIVEVHLVRAEEAYPVFDLGFEEHQALLTEQVEGLHNALSTGRQGAFCYPNMHTAMRMGADAAEDFIARANTLTPTARMRKAFEGRSAPGEPNGATPGAELASSSPAGADHTDLDVEKNGRQAAQARNVYMPDGDQRGATPAEELALNAPENSR